MNRACAHILGRPRSVGWIGVAPAIWSVLLAFGCATARTERSPAAFSSDIRLLEFSNGMRAVVARTPEDTLRPLRVFIGLYVGYGTASEAAPELAHLVEHIAANNRPLTVDYVVPESLTYYGSNAMTRSDYTSLWRAVAPEGFPAHLRSRANRVAGVQNDPAVFAREVGRVGGELARSARYEEENGRRAADMLDAAFRAGSSIAERRASLQSLTSDRVADEIRTYYRPGNTVLVVVGDIDMDSAVAEVRSVLGRYPPRDGPAPRVAPPFPPYAAAVTIADPRVSATKVGIGFAAPDRSDSERFLAFLILDQWLLGDRSAAAADEEPARDVDAPLGRRLAARLGITAIQDGRSYLYGPPRLASRSPSYVGAYFEVPGTVSVDSIEAAVREAYRDALTDDLTDAAVAAAKSELLDFFGTWLLKPDLLSLGDLLAAFTMIDGDPTRLNSLPQDVHGVSPQLVRRLAAGYLEEDGIRVGIVHPPR